MPLEEIGDYLDGRLGPERLRAFEERLRTDPDLAREVAELRAVGEAVRSAKDLVLPERFYAEARARFERASARPARRVPWKVIGLAAAAVILVAVFLPQRGVIPPPLTQKNEPAAVAAPAPSEQRPNEELDELKALGTVQGNEENSGAAQVAGANAPAARAKTAAAQEKQAAKVEAPRRDAESGDTKDAGAQPFEPEAAPPAQSAAEDEVLPALDPERKGEVAAAPVDTGATSSQAGGSRPLRDDRDAAAAMGGLKKERQEERLNRMAEAAPVAPPPAPAVSLVTATDAPLWKQILETAEGHESAMSLTPVFTRERVALITGLSREICASLRYEVQGAGTGSLLGISPNRGGAQIVADSAAPRASVWWAGGSACLITVPLQPERVVFAP